MDDKELKVIYDTIIKKEGDPKWEELDLSDEQKDELKNSLTAASYQLGKSMGRLKNEVSKLFKIKTKR